MGYLQKKNIDGVSTEVGYLTFDIRINGVGRIKRSSGTRDENTFNRYRNCIDEIYRSGDLEPLHALKNKRVTPSELYQWWKGGTPPPWKGANNSLSEAIETYFGQAEIADTTKVGYRNCFNQLQKVGSGHKVGDIPTLLKEYRAKCKREQKAKTFNQTRAACMALLREVMEGKSHPIYTATRDVKVIKTTEYRRKVFNPLYPSKLDSVLAGQDIDERIRDTVWVLCLTGAGPKEFLKDGIKVIPSRKLIEISGQKRATRIREVPLVFDDLEYGVWCQYKHLRKKFNEVFPGHTLYDCRRSFKVWMTRAGIDESRQMYYMGHKESTSTRYGRELIERWVMEDRVKMWTYIQNERDGVGSTGEEITSGMDIPKTPYSEASLKDKKLRAFWFKELDAILEGWYESGKMRKLYRVSHLTEVK